MRILGKDEFVDEFIHAKDVSKRTDEWNTNLIKAVE
jgi:hypothetical protein